MLVNARPTVRNVKTDREFQRLLKHHKEKTGLPVIVDYFSHGCGPCRQIAPHYKQLAKRYKGKAVFAKVDVNYNRETSGRQQIRSMPTFQFYLLGKKRHQFCMIFGLIWLSGTASNTPGTSCPSKRRSAISRSI